MASEIIDFLMRTFEIPYIAIVIFGIIVVSATIYDFKICKMSYSFMEEEIEELKSRNAELEGALKSYESNNN